MIWPLGSYDKSRQQRSNRMHCRQQKRTNLRSFYGFTILEWIEIIFDMRNAALLRRPNAKEGISTCIRLGLGGRDIRGRRDDRWGTLVCKSLFNKRSPQAYEHSLYSSPCESA